MLIVLPIYLVFSKSDKLSGFIVRFATWSCSSTIGSRLTLPGSSKQTRPGFRRRHTAGGKNAGRWTLVCAVEEGRTRAMIKVDRMMTRGTVDRWSASGIAPNLSLVILIFETKTSFFVLMNSIAEERLRIFTKSVKNWQNCPPISWKAFRMSIIDRDAVARKVSSTVSDIGSR